MSVKGTLMQSLTEYPHQHNGQHDIHNKWTWHYFPCENYTCSHTHWKINPSLISGTQIHVLKDCLDERSFPLALNIIPYLQPQYIYFRCVKLINLLQTLAASLLIKMLLRQFQIQNDLQIFISQYTLYYVYNSNHGCAQCIFITVISILSHAGGYIWSFV